MTRKRRTVEGLEVPTRFTVSPLPKGHPDRDAHSVLVENFEDERGWGVTHSKRGRLSRYGEWHHKPSPDNLTQEWSRDHLFTFVEAMHRARNLFGLPHPRRGRTKIEVAAPTWCR